LKINLKSILTYLKKNYLTIIIFLTILSAGIFFRTWDLANNPPGFFSDEANIAYNAYSILTDSVDEYGKSYPLFFKSFGEYRSPIEVYSSIPLVGLLGLTEVSVRLTSATWGLMGVITAYFIGKKLSSRLLGYIFMTGLSLSPWHIHLSRIGFVSQTIMVFFLLLCLLITIHLIQNSKNHKLFYLLGIFAALGSYSYFSARIVFPVFFGTSLLLILYKNKNFSLVKHVIFSIILFSALLLPLLQHTFVGTGFSRFEQTSFLNREDISPREKFIESYFQHFSVDYLFFKGDIDMPGQFITRHSVRGVGELFFWELPFVIFGFLSLYKKRSYLFLIILFLLLIYPVPSSISNAIPPQATRSSAGIVPITLLSAFGIYQTINMLKSQKVSYYLLISVFVLIFTFSGLGFYTQLQDYKFYSADFWGWQYGAKDILNYFFEVQDDYDELFMEGSFNGSRIFLKFYDPDNTCPKCRLGIIDLDYDSNKKQLFAFRKSREIPTPYKENFKVVYKLYYPNYEEAFIIGEIE